MGEDPEAIVDALMRRKQQGAARRKLDTDEIRELRAEVARLREALEAAHEALVVDDADGAYAVEVALRDALAPPEEPD